MALRFRCILNKSLPFIFHRANNSTFASAYKKNLNKHPILMQGVQASILMGIGDLIAQLIQKQDLKSIDWVRTGKFASIGLVVVGPTLRVWYGVLDRIATKSNPTIRTIQKVAFDQLVFAPVFIGVFISVVGAVQEPNINTIKVKLQNEYSDILFTNYMLWPWVQLINFRFTPLNYQVLVAQTVAIFWNAYLSWKTMAENESEGA